MEDAQQRKARRGVRTSSFRTLSSLLSQVCLQVLQNYLSALYRLKALREAAASTDEPTPEAAAPAGPELKFRNYAVRDRKIEHTVLEPAQPPKYEPPKPEAEVGKKPEVGPVLSPVQRHPD